MYFLDGDKDKKELKKKKKSSKKSKDKAKSETTDKTVQPVSAKNNQANDEFVIGDQKVCDIEDIWNTIFFGLFTPVKKLEQTNLETKTIKPSENDVKPAWTRPAPVTPKFTKTVKTEDATEKTEKATRKREKATAKNTRANSKSAAALAADNQARVEGEKMNADVMELKDLLTENTERRLKEGALADQIIEMELDSIRKKIEVDTKAQQARDAVRKKEMQRKQDEEAAKNAQTSVFAVFKPWAGSVTSPTTNSVVTTPTESTVQASESTNVPSEPVIHFPAHFGRQSSTASGITQPPPAQLARENSTSSGVSQSLPAPLQHGASTASGPAPFNRAVSSAVTSAPPTPRNTPPAPFNRGSSVAQPSPLPSPRHTPPAPFNKGISIASAGSNGLPSPRSQKDRSGSVSSAESSLSGSKGASSSPVPVSPRAFFPPNGATPSSPRGGSSSSGVNAAVLRVEDTVSPDDIANFLRFVSTDGVNCLFYLPTRDGDAKDKKAVIKCNPDTTLLRLDIYSGDYVNSPVGGSVPSKAAVVKSLTFDIFSDVMGVARGRGPIVPLSPLVNSDHIVHILLHNKPEINLNFGDRTTRDAVLVALPRHLNQMRIKHTVVVDDILSPKALLKNKHGHATETDATLMGLSKNLFKLTSMFWVELKVRSLIGGSRFELRLMITRSDLVLQFFVPPAEFEPLDEGEEAVEGAVTPEARQAGLVDQMRVFLQSKWNAEFLLDKHFENELEIPFSTLQKTVHVGQSETDNTIEIITDESTVKIRPDSAEKRRTITTFLEAKRKQVRKVVEK